jgi:hypothetical protein
MKKFDVELSHLPGLHVQRTENRQGHAMLPTGIF